MASNMPSSEDEELSIQQLRELLENLTAENKQTLEQIKNSKGFEEPVVLDVDPEIDSYKQNIIK